MTKGGIGQQDGQRDNKTVFFWRQSEANWGSTFSNDQNAAAGGGSSGVASVK